MHSVSGLFICSSPIALWLCEVWWRCSPWPVFLRWPWCLCSPADRPLSRTWSMVTQMAWETAKVSKPFTTVPLFTWCPSSLDFSFLLHCCHLSPYPPPAPPSQSSLSAWSIHLSLSTLVLLCLSPAVCLVPWSIECCVLLGKDWTPSCKPLEQHHTNIQTGERKGFWMCISETLRQATQASNASKFLFYVLTNTASNSLCDLVVLKGADGASPQTGEIRFPTHLHLGLHTKQSV